MMNTTYIPAEWAPQQAMIIGFPSHSTLWPDNLLLEAQQEVAALCNCLAETQHCYVLAANKTALATARRLITEHATIIAFNFGDIWFRDIAPIFKNPQQAIRFQHNGWGGKYLYPYDDCAAARLCEYFKISAQSFDIVLEGGALEHNGTGAILTTRQCLLNTNRNQWNIIEAESHLKKIFHAHTIYWLDAGLAFDHTDGHIDNTARFVGADTVICQQANGRDDLNRALYKKQAQDLLEQSLKVITVPSPGLIRDVNNHIMPASHLNFIISNKLIIFPHYLKDNSANKQCVGATKEILADIFNDREIISLPSNAILTGGGSFHCISQHIPC